MTYWLGVGFKSLAMCACLLHVCFYWVSKNLWVVFFPHYGDYLVHVTFSLLVIPGTISQYIIEILSRSVCVLTMSLYTLQSMSSVLRPPCYYSFEQCYISYFPWMVWATGSFTLSSWPFFSRAFNFLIFRYWFSQWCTCNTWCHNKLGVSCFDI